jgi:gamma-glutamyltranspeptidase/glutathione hydrolase
VGVPGTPALIQKIYDRDASGTLTLAELADPAIQLAEKGIPISKALAEKLIEHADRLRQFPATQKIFFHEDGSLLQESELLVQADLAKTESKRSPSFLPW